MACPGEGLGDAGTFYCPQDLVFIFFFSLLCFSYNDGVGRNSLFQKLPDDRNQIQMPFQARDAARQAQGEFPLQFRIGHEPAREPFPGGGVGRVILVRGNSIGYDSDMVRRGGRIMVKDVVPDAVGDGDHPLSPAHDGGVPIDGVEAVNAGDEAGTVFRRELFPCQVACPRRNAGMEMQDIRSDGLKQGAEGPDAEESGDAFLPIGIRMWREPSFSRRGTRRPPPETTIFSTPREERPLPSSITTCSTPPDSMEGTRCTIS